MLVGISHVGYDSDVTFQHAYIQGHASSFRVFDVVLYGLPGALYSISRACIFPALVSIRELFPSLYFQFFRYLGSRNATIFRPHYAQLTATVLIDKQLSINLV